MAWHYLPARSLYTIFRRITGDHWPALARPPSPYGAPGLFVFIRFPNDLANSLVGRAACAGRWTSSSSAAHLVDLGFRYLLCPGVRVGRDQFLALLPTHGHKHQPQANAVPAHWSIGSGSGLLSLPALWFGLCH